MIQAPHILHKHSSWLITHYASLLSAMVAMAIYGQIEVNYRIVCTNMAEALMSA